MTRFDYSACGQLEAKGEGGEEGGGGGWRGEGFVGGGTCFTNRCIYHDTIIDT